MATMIWYALGQMSTLSDDEPDKTICFCHNVSRGALLRAIESGSTTIDLIKADTCASTGCGGCENDVLEILEKALKDQKPGI